MRKSVEKEITIRDYGENADIRVPVKYIAVFFAVTLLLPEFLSFINRQLLLASCLRFSSAFALFLMSCSVFLCWYILSFPGVMGFLKGCKLSKACYN